MKQHDDIVDALTFIIGPRPMPMDRTPEEQLTDLLLQKSPGVHWDGETLSIEGKIALRVK